MTTLEASKAALQLELRVLSGIHQGAALLLVDDAIVVGSHADCDVVLLDDGVADQHLKVLRQGDAWVCIPIDNALVLAVDGQPVTVAQHIEPGMRFLMADVWIGFFEILSPWTPLRNSFETNTLANKSLQETTAGPVARNAARSRKLLWATVGLVLLCCGLIVVLLLFDTSTQVAEKPQPPVTQMLVAATAEKLQVPSADQLRDAAHITLKDYQIDTKTRVISSKGHLFLQAHLTFDERARFEQSLLALQRRFGANTLIEAKVTPVSNRLPFRVNQVVMGADPYILLDNEHRMYVGDRFAGFKLAAVQKDKLLFRGKYTVEVSW